MRLFGRKASQQSTKRPDALDVPPELRPYYREQALAARTRHVAVRLLSTLIILALLVGGGSWVWMHRRAIGRTVTNRLATNMPETQPKQSSGGNQNQEKNTPQPANKPTDNSRQTAPSTPSPQPPTSQPAPEPTPTPATTPPSSSATPIPNTGPGTMVVFGALVISLFAGAVYHLHQRRVTRSN